MSIRIIWLVFFMSAPLMAQAQAYKCKQPDGSLSFQDKPCSGDAASSKITLPPVTMDAVEPVNQPNRQKRAATQKIMGSENAWQTKERDDKRRRDEEEINAANQKILAHNKMISCHLARSQLEIANGGRPAYSLDNKGDRHYIEDENRQAAISSKERIVAQECL